MLQEFFQDSEWLHLPLIALVFFFVFFLVVVWRVVFRMRDPRRVDRLASLPFADENASGAPEEDRHG